MFLNMFERLVTGNRFSENRLGCTLLHRMSSRVLFTASIAVMSLCISEFRGANADTISSDNILYQHPNDAIVVGIPSEEDSLEKRAGFMPMRGRRDDDKRAGFLPARGKKESVYLLSEQDKRASAFMPMRGRRPEGANGGPKARYQGQYYDEELDDGLGYKRAAFMPMRGRKDMPFEEKRLQSFLPMRGRKWEPSSIYDDKRASAFTAMRGRKKNLYSNGGAKRLSAFMPMRGKKDSGEEEEKDHMDLMEDDIIVRPLDREEEASGTGPQDDKRAASSFFGMRGKRFARTPKSLN